MEKKTILVLGANGKTGSRVIDRLEKISDIEIRKGSRNEKVPFDWENPETWEPLLHGVNTVYITFQPDLAIPSAAENWYCITPILLAASL